MAKEVEKVSNYMLTTTDNPYNPFTQFVEWFYFDTQLGYHTCGLLDRFLVTSDELSETDQDHNINDAMDRIIEFDPFNMYRKVDKAGKYEQVPD